MKSALVSIFLAALIASPVVAAEIAIEGGEQQRSVSCDGQDVLIHGFKHNIELSGECGAIVIQGKNQTVTFEQATSLVVGAFESIVTGGLVGDVAISHGANTVEVNVSGGEAVIHGFKHNVFLKLSGATVINVSGAESSVRWSLEEGVPPPTTNISGFANSIEQAN